MKFWIDITNTPHVHVLLPIINHLKKKHEVFITARDFSETIGLLNKFNLSPIIIGDYKGKNRIAKSLGLLSRLYQLNRKIEKFDISLSLGGNYTSTIGRLRKKASIVFSDNDISFKGLAFRYANDFIFPSYFDFSPIQRKYNIKDERIHTFEGFKEDIYIADYTIDPNFLVNLPFEEFITIRPENLKASYVPKDSTSIVPKLFEIFSDENILFLPRYPEEREYAKGYTNIFIPDKPLSGLDVCYYTKAMLTGAGTFAREAAILGTPAVSFFPGKTFLTVDTIMQQKGWEFKSRDPELIRNYLKDAKKRPFKRERSQQVLSDVIKIIDNIIAKY